MSELEGEVRIHLYADGTAGIESTIDKDEVVDILYEMAEQLEDAEIFEESVH